MSNINSDLPGSSTDPETGQYNTEAREGAVNPSLREPETERQEGAFQSENPVKNLSITNVLKLFRSRELGSITGLPVEREYYKLRTFRMKDRMQDSLNNYQPNKIVSVEFIKGYQNAVLGVWKIERRQPTFVIGKKTLFGPNEPQPSHFKVSPYFVTDVCAGPRGSIMYAYICRGKGYFSLFIQGSKTMSMNFWDTPVRCVESTRSGETFAFGCENLITLFTFDPETISCKSTVHALSFDETGNVLMAGADGYLCLYDIRQRKQEMELPVSNYCLTDISFLNPHQIIVAGQNNVLITVDLRMKRPVTEFYSHVSTSLRKRPFSFADNMLCVSGSDNVSRIWHLSGGNPIYEMKPVEDIPFGNATRALLYGDSHKTYFYHFEKDMERMFECMELQDESRDL